jgi:pyruvate dehydrogenase E1 component alpha subunit
MIKIIKNIYNLSVKSRLFQIKINEFLRNKKIIVPLHLAFGHEIIAALVKSLIQKNDKIVLPHRNIHFVSLFSKNPLQFYKNLFQNKYHKLKTSGSMNYFENNNQIAYTSSILGNNFSVSCGISFFQKKKSILICVAGDGAIEEGSFYESLCLAKYMRIPILYLIENNQWSMYTKIKDRRCEINLSKLCASLKINYESLSFKNFNYTIKQFKKNISVCRNLKEPVVVEFNIKTLGHFIKNNKYINYHHGMANLSLIDKIFFNRSETLYKLKELIDKN